MSTKGFLEEKKISELMQLTSLNLKLVILDEIDLIRYKTEEVASIIKNIYR